MTNRFVIVPTYNELENIESILDRIHAAVPEAQIVVVDDNSPDGTATIVARRAELDSRITVLSRSHKSGLGSAYREGFRYALEHGADYVAEIDADGSHDPRELHAMFALAESHSAGLVIGSRWIPGGSVVGWSWVRQAISRAGNAYAKFALQSTVNDMTAGFRVLSRSALEELQRVTTASNGYSFQVEVTHILESAGFDIVEHPITFRERATGVSKMHTGIVVEALFLVTRWGIQRLLFSNR
ncbi:MAG: hypothetical protein RIS25_308 [Actinomycetota bacterium]